MRNWIILVLIYIFALLEATLLNNFKFFGIKPDLLLVIIVILSVFWEWRWVLFFSLFAGILKDTFCFEPFGLNTILFPLISYLVYKVSRKISVEDIYALMVITFIAVFLNNIISRIIFAFSGKIIPFGIFMRVIFIESLYSAVISPLVVKVLDLLRCYSY
ncbi:MAG: rod shape-determining protein MreD [Candidatus Omnitrophota bacterium]